MDIRITESELKGVVRAVSSKSDAHRALICASLISDCEKEPVGVYCNAISEDIKATVRVLSALGVQFSYKNEYIYVSPMDIKELEGRQAELKCGESGSTLRFMIPVAAGLGASATFSGEGRLPERPIDMLLKELMLHGMKADGIKLPFSIGGKLEGGDYKLKGNISSQFFTGILLALPVIGKDSSLEYEGKLESSRYVDMTIKTMEAFGVHISKTDKGFIYKSGEKYKFPSENVYETEGDWSNAAFFVVADALMQYKYGSDESYICVDGLNDESLQGDKRIKEIVAEALLNSKSGKGCEIDASEIPDLVPIVAVLYALIEGRHVIKNAGRLRIKESDRLSAIYTVLKAIGADIEELPDGLIINGKNRLKGGRKLPSYGDHRIVMSLSIAGLFCDEPIVIEGAEAVNKSYPSFFEAYRKIGGRADVITNR
ncbi:MAG: 3-phosphoshikimate 1-carboxyvinyltransferase [Eubacteriales bacterium]|nr:3-phosphoshikimate 1-carboxyvinyltransferase [Eubacteriales bacterium]